jgi:hypothetical protein
VRAATEGLGRVGRRRRPRKRQQDQDHPQSNYLGRNPRRRKPPLGSTSPPPKAAIPSPLLYWNIYARGRPRPLADRRFSTTTLQMTTLHMLDDVARAPGFGHRGPADALAPGRRDVAAASRRRAPCRRWTTSPPAEARRRRPRRDFAAPGLGRATGCGRGARPRPSASSVHPSARRGASRRSASSVSLCSSPTPYPALRRRPSPRRLAPRAPPSPAQRPPAASPPRKSFSTTVAGEGLDSDGSRAEGRWPKARCAGTCAAVRSSRGVLC